MDRPSSGADVLLELRERAVSLKKAGKTHVEIAPVLNIGHSTSRLYWKLYRAGSNEGIQLGRRGSPVGLGCKLDAKQQRKIQSLITDRTPDQLKMSFASTTRSKSN